MLITPLHSPPHHTPPTPSGTKPPPPRGTADVPLYAALHRGHITLYRDTSGDSLHRRGYRDAMHKANLNESVAAGALMLADWPRLSQQGARLVDPMCGSGTFLLEAVLMAQHVAPGLFRKRWPFQQWPDHEPKVWLELIQRAQQVQTTYKVWGCRVTCCWCFQCCFVVVFLFLLLLSHISHHVCASGTPHPPTHTGYGTRQ